MNNVIYKMYYASGHKDAWDDLFSFKGKYTKLNSLNEKITNGKFSLNEQRIIISKFDYAAILCLCKNNNLSLYLFEEIYKKSVLDKEYMTIDALKKNKKFKRYINNLQMHLCF